MDDLTEKPYRLLLDHVGKYIFLDPEEQQLFLSLLEPANVARKTFLLRQGAVCRYETFVLEGCLRSYTIDEQGTEHTLLFGVEDWWVGDLYSFLTGAPSLYNISALEDTRVLQISRQNLEQLYGRVPKFERFFRIIIQNAFIAQQRRINENLSLTGEERYRSLPISASHLNS
jgi:CRP-like cAMP-binding protein